MKIKIQSYNSKSQRKVKAILLDLDGVIIKNTFKVNEAKRGLVEKLEKLRLDVSTISVDDTFMDIMAKAEKQVVESKKLDLEYLKKSMSAVLDKFDFEALSRSELIGGARLVINELRRRSLKLGLVTSSGRARVKVALEKFGLSGCFDVVVSRNDVERIKPSGESVQKAVSTLGYATNEVAYVGDSWADVVASKNAGVMAIAIVGGASPKEKILQASPDVIISSLDELLGIIAEK
jgi:HAD superfamily hydrolase (TIGR01509 family)